jgi:hypothetical protein
MAGRRDPMRGKIRVAKATAATVDVRTARSAAR